MSSMTEDAINDRLVGMDLLRRGVHPVTGKVIHYPGNASDVVVGICREAVDGNPPSFILYPRGQNRDARKQCGKRLAEAFMGVGNVVVGAPMGAAVAC